MPETSVLIVCNRERYLKETVRNLLATCEGDIEILIQFDGRLQRIPKDKRVKRFVSEHLRGRRVSLNELVTKAQGDYFFHTDGHCWMLQKGWDKKLI